MTTSVKMRMAGGFVAAAIVALAGTLPTQADDVKSGRQIAEQLCQPCHAIGASGESTHGSAPSFGEIASRYSVWTLQEALAEGILVGHEDMPQFKFTPEQIDALLTYMDTLSPDDTAQ
ncbi:MAG: c-type cytochrome [Dichotomicrobium sp.]